MKLFEELKWRNMIKDCNDEQLAEERLNNEKLTFYIGFDPTGKSLTVGHLVQIVRMRFMQEKGFHAICLVGGATGLIGDPRDVGERKLLTVEQTLENAELIKKQLSKYLIPEKTTFVNNYDWISKINVIEFLRDYGKNFNINYMLGKDVIARRLEQGISYTEFSYLLLQSLDFLHLFENYNCQLQFGGSDQWGNITSGLELIRKKHGETKVLGLSSPLLLKADGKKFGKSEGGAIWIDENLTSPYELYQYFLNVEDSIVINSLKVLTLLSVEEIKKLEEEVKTNPGERVAQKTLANEVVRFVHGEQNLQLAKNITNSLFTSDFSNLKENEWKVMTKTLNTVELDENKNIIDLIVDLNLAQSKREARQFIESGAISVNEVKVDSFEFKVNQEISYLDKYFVFKRGKKKFAIGVFKH